MFVSDLYREHVHVLLRGRRRHQEGVEGSRLALVRLSSEAHLTHALCASTRGGSLLLRSFAVQLPVKLVFATLLFFLKSDLDVDSTTHRHVVFIEFILLVLNRIGPRCQRSSRHRGRSDQGRPRTKAVKPYRHFSALWRGYRIGRTTSRGWWRAKTHRWRR
jgi:hypothetical protein